MLVLASLATSSAIPCAENTTESTPTEWPAGSYALPMALTGCPEGHWVGGAFYQDTEDHYNGNKWNTTHFLGFHKKDGFMRAYCTMVNSSSSETWPAGSYCINKKNQCPAGFLEGYLKWDDENTYNMNDIATSLATLPDGTYDNDTRVDYCCRDDGDVSTSMALPIAEPFYLIMKSDTCQKVAGMSVTSEKVQWDDEDSSNGNRRVGSTPFDSGTRFNIDINYCYYE